MKIQVFAREGQSVCGECGSPFEIDSSAHTGGAVSATTCPGVCNRGSWVSFDRDIDFCVPVEMDFAGLRRKIEDRLRKDPDFFIRVCKART